MNIVERIFESCEPGHIALIGRGEKLSFGELKTRSYLVAEELEKTGLFHPGDGRIPRIALSCPNGIDHILLSIAILKAGGCLVPVPDELTAKEREELLTTTGCCMILCGEGRTWDGVGKAISVQSAVGETVLYKVPQERISSLSFDEDEFAKLNPALVRFSSGTTGRSKGVILSHETLLDRVTTCNSRLRIGPDDKVIWVLPMAHHFAVSIVLYLLHGATTVVLDSHLGEDVDAGIRDFGGTVIYGAPFHHQMLADFPEGRPYSTLRLAVSTAAPLPEQTARVFFHRYGLPLTQGLGIIELGLPLLNDEAALSKPLSVGKPQRGFEVKILKPDKDGVGEILLKGPGMFDAYLSPWILRSDSVDGQGWFHTGDLGQIDEDGFITMKGRIKSVINVAGMKVFPEEVEPVLNDCPGIAESRVFAVPHPVLGQVPAAELVAENPEDRPPKSAVLSFCRELLSQYRVPMKLTWVKSLTRTPSGKLKR